jgi:Spy/CpxP family protein refolding chaperone
MSHRVNRIPATAAALLAGAFMLGVQPALAQGSGAGNAPAAAPGADNAAKKPMEQSEKRIKELQAKLQLTPAQEPQWEAFVQAEREAAQQVSQLIQQRDQNLQSMNAVDDFRSYEQIADAHADGLKKVVSAFQALYDSLSDTQKQTADALFADRIAKHAKRS